MMAIKFTIVTPVYNGEKYLAETIESVLSQEGDFEIEYIIRDGASTDNTLSVIKSYDEKLRTGAYPIKCKGIMLAWHSEKDAGMYDAISKGFARATGDICAYLNADDLYLPGAFAAVANIFIAHPDIEWLKGITAFCDEQGVILSSAPGYLYRQEWLQKGIYGRSAYFVHQDSVFWRRSLWEKARPVLSSFRLAGDYALWITFAKHVPLWSFNTRVSVFRKRSGQLSADMGPYRREQEQIASHHFLLEKRVLLFFSVMRFFTIRPAGGIARALFFILFPLNKQQWYLDMSIAGQPIKKRAASYLMEDHDSSPPMAQKREI